MMVDANNINTVTTHNVTRLIRRLQHRLYELSVVTDYSLHK